MVAYSDEQIILGDQQPRTIDRSKELFTAQGVCELLGRQYGICPVSERSIRKAARNKALKSLPRHAINQRYLFTRVMVQEWVYKGLPVSRKSRGV